MKPFVVAVLLNKLTTAGEVLASALAYAIGLAVIIAFSTRSPVHVAVAAVAGLLFGLFGTAKNRELLRRWRADQA